MERFLEIIEGGRYLKVFDSFQSMVLWEEGEGRDRDSDVPALELSNRFVSLRNKKKIINPTGTGTVFPPRCDRQIPSG